MIYYEVAAPILNLVLYIPCLDDQTTTVKNIAISRMEDHYDIQI